MVQVTVLLGLVCLPFTLVPYPVIWLYDKMLWFSEPLLLIVEVLAVMRIITMLTKFMTDHIDEEPTASKVSHGRMEPFIIYAFSLNVQE